MASKETLWDMEDIKIGEMITSPILQPNNDEELAETKRKLEIAVKGLKEMKIHLELIIDSRLIEHSPSYIMLNKYLEKLGVE